MTTPPSSLNRLISVATRWFRHTPTPATFKLDQYEQDSVRQFDSAHYQQINQARLNHLAQLGLPLDNRVVLDVGSGPGDMAQFFVQRGNRVLCVDGREDNIAQMRERYPDLEGHHCDVQVPHSLDAFGPVDIVFCYGLLYHVENPIQVLRNLAAVTGDLLLLSTIICDAKRPLVQFVPERNTATQALDGIGCRPSPSLIVATLMLAGFEHIYRPTIVPDHPEFHFKWRNNLDWQRRGHPLRAVFIASRQPLDKPRLERY